jgi:hypothetical protein
VEKMLEAIRRDGMNGHTESHAPKLEHASMNLHELVIPHYGLLDQITTNFLLELPKSERNS